MQPSKKRRRPLRMVAISLAVLIVVVALGGYLYLRVINGLFDRETGLELVEGNGQTINILMVGSDSREGLDDPLDEERFGDVGGKRADTIIVAQLVPGEQRGVLLSFPRDLYVDVHGGGRQFRSKINAAYQYGAQGVIDTVGALTGLPIHHYMEIDIRGFRSMVDAIGGIDICLDKNFYDSKLNLRLPAGNNHLDGNTALSYVRARQATPDGDFGRMKRQQQFMRAVLSRVSALGVIGNPVRVNSLARAFASNVTVDQYFQLPTFMNLALNLKRIGPDQLETFSVPGNSGRAGGASVVYIDDTKAQGIFTAMRNGTDPATVTAQSTTAAQPSSPSTGGGAPVAQAGPCGAPAA